MTRYRSLTAIAGSFLVATASILPASPATAAAPTLTWTPCGELPDEVRECASLQVPLDYADPTGPMITLALARIPARFERFKVAPLRVPHMGWNIAHPVGTDPVFDPDLPELRYYFTHSFHAVCDDESVEIGRTHYGIDFTSAYRRGNTRGVQFHPEKSHRFGMSLLARWAELPC